MVSEYRTKMNVIVNECHCNLQIATNATIATKLQPEETKNKHILRLLVSIKLISIK